MNKRFSWLRELLWMGGGTAVFLFAVGVVFATTNIDATNRYAWNDLIGWIDFYDPGTVGVTSQNLNGYASSSVGDVSLDCHTTRNGNICAQSDYQVTSDGSASSSVAASLSNYAWNDQYGWISFDCLNNGGCASSSYQVLVDSNDGTFSGYAWNDTAGWISFNCTNNNGCNGTSTAYKVQTTWVATSAIATLDSTTFDTGVSGGAQINSVLWHGTQPSGTSVRFQFATSNSSSGPWTYVGSNGTSDSSYLASRDVSTSVDYTIHSGKRYFRYRVILISNKAQTLSPTVQEVDINWSP